jgi:ABC-2 type transport system ATP-binding protein
MDVVEVRGLWRSYGGVDALRGVDLRVGEGERVAVLGPNGAGSTTLLEILAGRRRPTAGAVRVLGQDPAAAGRSRCVGAVAQHSTADPTMTVGEAVANVAATCADPRPAFEVLEHVGLAGHAGRPIGRLSGGELRLLDLALAVVGRPQLVLLDQPTTGLDPLARRTAWQLVREVADAGTTVVFASHRADEAQALADRVVVLVRGVVVADDTPQRLGGREDGIVIRFQLPERFEGTVLPVTATRHGERWEVHTRTPTRDMAVLSGWALDRRLELPAVEVVRPSLEDVYMGLVERAALIGLSSMPPHRASLPQANPC